MWKEKNRPNAIVTYTKHKLITGGFADMLVGLITSYIISVFFDCKFGINWNESAIDLRQYFSSPHFVDVKPTEEDVEYVKINNFGTASVMNNNEILKTWDNKTEFFCKNLTFNITRKYFLVKSYGFFTISIFFIRYLITGKVG